MKDYATITLKSFSGGMRDRDHPSELLENQYSYGKNIILRTGGLYGRRMGRTKKTNSPGALPQGGTWYAPSPTQFFIIQVNGGKIYKWEGSSANFTEIDSSVQLVNTSKQVSFGILRNKLFIFSGTDDNVYSWDGSSPTLTDEGNANTDPPSAYLCTSQSGKLIAGRTDSAGTDNLIYPSSPNDGTVWDRTSNNRAIPSEGDEGIKALAMYRNSEVLVFTLNTFHTVDVSASAVTDWTRKTISTKIGSISPWVVVLGDDAFFMSPDGHIRSARRTAFDVTYGVIQPVTEWNPNLVGRLKRTRLNKSRGVWYDNYLLVAGCFDNSDTNNGVIVFDMLHQIQTPTGTVPVCVGEWTNMNPCEWIVAHFNNRQQLYYIDSVDGSLYLMFDGEDDDGTAIQSEVQMRSLDFGTQRQDKTVLDGELQVFDTNGTINIYCSKDNGYFETLKNESVGTAGAQLPFTLPVTLGSGGILDFIPFSFYGIGQSRFWQPKIIHSGGALSLKQITLRAKIHNPLSRGY